MKKLFVIIILFAGLLSAQTSNYTRYFSKNGTDSTAGVPLLGALIYLVPQANTYPTGALQLTEHSARKGVYYRDNVPDGEYKIYIDVGSGASLYLQHQWIGESRLTRIADKFNSSDQITSVGIAGSAVLDTNIAANAVDSNKIIDGTVTGTDIKPGTLQSSNFPSLFTLANRTFNFDGNSTLNIYGSIIGISGSTWQLPVGTTITAFRHIGIAGTDGSAYMIFNYGSGLTDTAATWREFQAFGLGSEVIFDMANHVANVYGLDSNDVAVQGLSGLNMKNNSIGEEKLAGGIPKSKLDITIDSLMTAGTGTFEGTAIADTVTVTGGASSSLYVIEYIGQPNANDLLKYVEVLPGGFVLHRAASGTTNISYTWAEVGTGNYVPEAVSLFDRVAVDGGSMISRDAANYEIKWAKALGIWDSVAVWYTFDGGLKKDGSNKISTVYDLKGSHDLIQSNGTKQPTYSASGMGGYPSATFLNTSLYSNDSLDLSASKDINVFAVIKGNSSQSDDIVTLGSLYTTDKTFALTTNSTGNISFSISGDVGTVSAPDSLLTSSPTLIAGYGYKSMPGMEAQLYLNGLRTMNLNATNNTDNYKKRILNVGSRNNASNYFDGSISAILILKGRYGMDTMRTIQNHFASKYGITLNPFQYIASYNVDSTNTGVTSYGDTLYVAAYPNNIAVRLKSSPGTVVRHIYTGGFFHTVQGIEYDSYRNCLWATGASFDNIKWYMYKISLAGALLDSIYIGDADAGDLAYDYRTDRMWYRQKDVGKIFMYALSTKTLADSILLTTASGEGLAIDFNYSNRFITARGSYTSYFSYSGTTSTLLTDLPYPPEFWVGDGANAGSSYKESYWYDSATGRLWCNDDQLFHGSIPGGNRLWVFKLFNSGNDFSEHL